MFFSTSELVLWNDCGVCVCVSTCCERASIITIRYAKQLATICLWNSIFHRWQSTGFWGGKKERARYWKKRQEIFQASWKEISCQHWLHVLFSFLLLMRQTPTLQMLMPWITRLLKRTKKELRLDWIQSRLLQWERWKEYEYEFVSLENANPYLPSMLHGKTFKTVADWNVKLYIE